VRNVAVIGAGIAGLSAAWLLSRTNKVVLYEAEGRAGGHANTATFPSLSGRVDVDTGFIVYNELNYPNLVALFAHLGVETEASDMSFSASLEGGRLEYSSEGLNGLIGQRGNVLKPRFWAMLGDIVRFYNEAPRLLDRHDLAGLTLGDYLDRERYSQAFVRDHLLPMGAAIWSTTVEQMRDYPLLAFVRFFKSHGLLRLVGRPQWRTVTGGSRRYVSRLIEDGNFELRLGAPVVSVERRGEMVAIRDSNGSEAIHTDVVFATHADQALALLDDPDAGERNILSAFRYTENTAVLHADPRLMPRRRRTWSSWNYIGEPGESGDDQLCVTYWMNRLQNLNVPEDYFVTLNPVREIAPHSIVRTIQYRHPLFTRAAIEAQPLLWQLQGQRNTWFCGSYFGHGFHEDALQSGLAVAEAMGGASRPWSVDPRASRIHTQPMLAAAE